MICPSCQHVNRPNAHFCANCRTPLLLQNKYRIVRLLGRGGYGAVYYAEQFNLRNAPCAVKELLPAPNATPQQEQQAAAQFQFEANVLARLSDPALPRVTDSFQEGGRYYLVMEYVEGETLEEQLARTRAPLPEAQVLAWAQELCDVLNYLHTRQPNPVIHRDVKPSNIKITPDGRLKLIDFGIAKLHIAGVGTQGAARAVSPPYSPIEQYGKGTDARSDIYALGVTLYQLLTNRLPPEAPDRASEPVLQLRQLNPALAPTTEAVVMQAMAGKAADRFQDATEMKRALTASLPTVVRPVAAPMPQLSTFAPIVREPVPFQPTIPASTIAVLAAQGRSRNAVWVASAIGVIFVCSLAASALAIGIIVNQQAQAAATATAAARVATSTAQAQATAWAGMTATAQAQATATALAQATGTARAQATLTAQASATAQAQASATAWAKVAATASALAQQSATARAQASVQVQATTMAGQKVTLVVINNYSLAQDVYIDGSYVVSVGVGQRVTTLITRGVHRFQSCYPGRNPRDNPESCGTPDAPTYDVQTDPFTFTIHD